MTDQIPTITLSPTPPSQGGRLTISYTGTPGTTLNLDWHPSGSPTTVKIDQNGQSVVVVPTTATSLIVSDPTGGAANASTVVVP